MLKRTRRNIIDRRSTRVNMTCKCMSFPLWLERHSSFLLSFVRFSYQFSSVICLFLQFITVQLILYYFYTYIFYFVLYFSCLSGCVGWWLCSRLWARNEISFIKLRLEEWHERVWYLVQFPFSDIRTFDKFLETKLQVGFEWGNVLGNSSVDGTKDLAFRWHAVLVVLQHRVLL
jgi:hypothetical protein